jgi:hypothetical protein
MIFFYTRRVRINSLGRWFINFNSQINNKKIYQANIDHCGYYYIFNRNQIEKSEDYFLPFLL